MFALKQKQSVSPTATLEIVEKPAQNLSLDQSEARRQMYERIAAGNALSELEDKASRQFHGK